MTEVQQAVLEAGMDATITKPINPRAFLRVMHSFLRPAAGAGEPGPAPGARAPLPASGGGGGAGLDRDLVGPILDRLLDYVKGRSGRAERYLEGYQRELAGLPAGDLAQVAAKLKDFDFPAARGAILSLARRHDIQLSAGHTGGEP